MSYCNFQHSAEVYSRSTKIVLQFLLYFYNILSVHFYLESFYVTSMSAIWSVVRGSMLPNFASEYTQSRREVYVYRPIGVTTTTNNYNFSQPKHFRLSQCAVLGISRVSNALGILDTWETSRRMIRARGGEPRSCNLTRRGEEWD